MSMSILGSINNHWSEQQCSHISGKLHSKFVFLKSTFNQYYWLSRKVSWIQFSACLVLISLNVWPVLSFFLCVKYPFYYGKSRKGKYQVSIIFSRRVFTYKIFLKGKYPRKCLKCLTTDSLCQGKLLSKSTFSKSVSE